ncbi:MAG TPA: hypothetical protein DDW53_03205 [Lachnoclostridium sp.]|nr:hypothetical protein [Lachnoclostridium sp.]
MRMWGKNTVTVMSIPAGWLVKTSAPHKMTGFVKEQVYEIPQDTNVASAVPGTIIRIKQKQ